MFGDRLGPALGGMLGANVGMLSGIFGSRSKKRAETRQCQMAADLVWSRHQDHLPSYDDLVKLREEVDELQRIVFAAERANEIAAALSPREYAIPAHSIDPVTGEPWHRVNFRRLLNEANEADCTSPAGRPSPSDPPQP